jgi:two-component system cell cycle sensor histidine kinase/response regulator CckA
MHCPAAQVRPAVTQRSRTSVMILVIEDERFVRDVTCEILRNAGYQVLQADCAEAARKMFQRYGTRIRLLLCDAVLPDSSGIVLALTLCRLSAGLKVILASGYPKGRLQDLDKKIGDSFLAKPYGAVSLLSKVQQALQKEVESAARI